MLNLITLSSYFVFTISLLFVWSKFGIKDIPDHRSQHHVITPTSAGVCFVLPFVVYSLFFKCNLVFTLSFLILGTLGLFDDWKEIGYKLRLFVHILCVISLLNYFQFNFSTNCLLFFVGVGLINSCNFLDGVNGFLSSQWLLTVGFLLSVFFGFNCQIWFIWIGVFAFLFFNFPKASLFMGDSGSTVLGFSYFYLILEIIKLNTNFIPSLIIPNDLTIAYCLFPMAFAWVDVLSTLLMRIVKNHSLILSYKDYGFHKIAIFFKSHIFSTLTYLCLNFILCLFSYLILLNHQYLFYLIFTYFIIQITFLYLIIRKIG